MYPPVVLSDDRTLPLRRLNRSIRYFSLKISLR
jgi:hypothetical protein